MRRLSIIILSLSILGCGKDSELIKQVLSPGVADLVFPENNSLCTTGISVSDTQSDVIFEWTESENADSYEVTLVNLETNESIVHTTSNTQLTIRLFKSTAYSWHVTSSIDSNGNSSDSEIASFYNSGPGQTSHIPFPAIAVSPINNSQVPMGTSSVTLQWQSEDLDGDIVDYDIYFDTDNTPALLVQNSTSNTIENIDVTPATEYFWRVLTRDAVGNVSYSEIFSFTVGN